MSDITIATVTAPSFVDGRNTLTPRLHLRVSYMKGGPNYFNGKVNPRGYSISVDFDRRSDEGFVSLLIDGKGNPAALIESAKRFNQKKLEAIAQQVRDGKHDELVERLYARAVFNRNNHAWPASILDVAVNG